LGAVGVGRVCSRRHLRDCCRPRRTRHSIEWAVARESRKRLRFLPAQASTNYAAAAAQFYWHEIVFAARKMRPGEAHQDAAIVDPFVETIERIGDIADIGED